MTGGIFLSKCSGIVTTSLKVRREYLESATRISMETDLPLVDRGKKTISELMTEWDVAIVIVVKANKVVCLVDETEFFFHPGMSVLRINDLKLGKDDTMIKAMNLKPGQRLLDCTLGLGIDAIVASYIVGKNGLVIGMDSSSIVAAVIRAGMAMYNKASRELTAAMRNVIIKNADHRIVLTGLPENSFDVVYFDPMFKNPHLQSSGMNALRPLANYQPLTSEVIGMALRIAAQRVVVKDSVRGKELKKLGFNCFEKARNGSVVFGIMHKGD